MMEIRARLAESRPMTEKGRERISELRKKNSSGRTGCAIGQTVKSSEKQSWQYQKDKLKAAVFKLILRMQDVVFLFIWTCNWSMMQLFDCRVPGKFQLLQIPETCDGASTEGEMDTLRETYILSSRKLIKKNVLVTPEKYNKAGRGRIVTLPDLTTRSIRVWDCLQAGCLQGKDEESESSPKRSKSVLQTQGCLE